MTELITEETARAMRKLWFDYLDAVQPVRSRLHAYCLRLTGSVFDAEDLVQDTLLRGFGAIGRADHSPPRDLHGNGGRWFDKPQAYLSQIATNLWIDRQRRRTFELSGADSAVIADPLPDPSIITAAAGAVLFDRTAPQERAAIVLKDVFEFSLEEIAQMLATTVGAVKAALHRGRDKLEQARTPTRNNPASAELIDRFIAAFNARDVESVTGLLLESVTYEPQGVGGEHGREKTIWRNVPRPDGVVAERHLVQGERVLAYTYLSGERRYLVSLARLEEVAGRVSRIVNYHFCPDTLALAASELGMSAWSNGYHQDEETLGRMIADASLPWKA